MLGSILGCTMCNFHNTSGHTLPGANHLFTILISQSLDLIWKIHCKWQIQCDADPSCLHTTQEIHNHWLATINAKLHLNCLLTDHHWYGHKALNSTLVQCTWQGTLHDKLNLPNDWHKSTGVLVGIEAQCPPGHSC